MYIIIVLFGITCTVTFQLICWGTYTQIYPEINFHVYLHASLLSNHKDLPVTTPICVHAHRSTHSLLYLFILILSFQQTFSSYLSSHLLFYITQIYTFTSLPVPFSFHLVLNAHLSVNSSAGLHTDRLIWKGMYLLILMFLANHEDLPAHSTVYMSIHATSQNSPCSFLCIHSKLPPQSTCPPS